MHVLSVENINKEFSKTKAVNNISFDVKAGEILGVLGPNGAGKSTTIRSIMGIILPDSGQINFSFKSIQPSKNYKPIGYLPEERGLYRDVKVMDVLLYLADLKGYPLDKAKKRALDYMEKFDLSGKEKSKVEELSKGMAQKVQFIASVIHEPELLILDEPFSGLDPVSQDVFKDEIRSIAQNGTAILLSSHQMNLVEVLCDRLFLINKGEKVLYGPLDKIKENYANFRCSIIGDNEHIDFMKFPFIEKIEDIGNKKTLYFKNGTIPETAIRDLSLKANIRELYLDRISLHDIFVNVAKGGKSIVK